MASSKDRDTFVYVAKLAEQAERYDGFPLSFSCLWISNYPTLTVRVRVSNYLITTWILLCFFLLVEMVDSMKKVAKLDVELTVEERNLLSVGFKNVIGARRASWRILSSIEQKEEAKGNDQNVKRIKEYRQKVESELSGICSEIMTVIDEHLIPSSSAGESTVFYYKMWVFLVLTWFML